MTLDLRPGLSFYAEAPCALKQAPFLLSAASFMVFLSLQPRSDRSTRAASGAPPLMTPFALVTMTDNITSHTGFEGLSLDTGENLSHRLWLFE